MRVFRRMVECALDLAHGFLPEYVLHFLGVIMHVVRCNLGLVGQVQLL